MRAREIVGYTIGNDMSSRDIEGENPLYLPQAKTYDGSCALGPSMLVADEPLSRGDDDQHRRSVAAATIVFEGSTTIAQMRRTPDELVEFLYRETSFPSGCVLLTGTGVVPPDDFTLQSGDAFESRSRRSECSRTRRVDQANRRLTTRTRRSRRTARSPPCLRVLRGQ